jgi:hypothetical protein
MSLEALGVPYAAIKTSRMGTRRSCDCRNRCGRVGVLGEEQRRRPGRAKRRIRNLALVSGADECGTRDWTLPVMPE